VGSDSFGVRVSRAIIAAASPALEKEAIYDRYFKEYLYNN
jgi:hypothetical protein